MASTKLDLKSSFLKNHALKLSELARQQSNYKRAFAGRMKNFRRNQVDKSKLVKRLEKLRKEKAEIKTIIWTATGAAYQKVNDKYEKDIKCHIKCEENLSEHIKTLKTGIANLTRELGRISRELFDLNRHSATGARAIRNMQSTKKRLMIRENLLEVGIQRECKMAAENEKLREQLLQLLHERKIFDNHYFKMIQKLNSDKRYMTDLIGYAMQQYDSCIELYEKFDAAKKRTARLWEQKKSEMRNITRMKAAMADESGCLLKKMEHRKLRVLTAKEYERRQRKREELKKNVNINKDVLDKIFTYTGEKNISGVIDKFKEQESLYYSYFNYANETSYHMTLLNNAVNRLLADIDNLKHDNGSLIQNQLEQIQSLEQYLENKRKSNAEMQTASEKDAERLKKLFKGFELIRDHTRTQWDSLQKYLGNYESVDLQNLRDQLKLVEDRIMCVIAAVYYSERQGEQRDYLVGELVKDYEYTTALDDIVLTQQCPECAKMDEFDVDEAEEDNLMSVNRVKKKICDRVTQPEMQYRLHSMSSCRFPRARALTAQRDLELQQSYAA